MSPINRRQFMRAGALGLASLPALSMLGCAPEPEPVVEAPPPGPPLGMPIGVQLYTVRNECEKDFEGALKRIAEIGYKQVEVYDFYGRTAADVKKLLDANGLKAPSGHWMLPVLRKNLKQAIEDAKTIGCEYMIMPILMPNERRNLNDYRRHAETFNKIGKACKEAGIQFGYHNHNFEFQEFDGVTAFDELMSKTDPDVVKIELDCYWVTRAGKDPVDYFKKYAGRVHLLHIKDAMQDAPVSTELDEGRGYFTEIGRGKIDWARIFGNATEAGVRHYFVEQDQWDGSPFDSIQVSHDYLMNLKV